MTKEEIRKKILEFKTDEEIMEFINSRIDELEKNTLPETIGLEHKTIYDGFISSKTNYIVGHTWLYDDFPKLVYDDVQPYFDAIKAVVTNQNYFSEIYLFQPMFAKIREYLPDNKDFHELDTLAQKRNKIYINALRENMSQVSIKELHKEKLGLCGEKAGLAQNIFKILGVDSQVVIGEKDGETHSFNLLFPYGYGNEPAVLYDPSFSIDFTDGEKVNLMAYYKVLTSEEYESMLSGKATPINIEKSANIYTRIHPSLEGCPVNNKISNYLIYESKENRIDNSSNSKK